MKAFRPSTPSVDELIVLPPKSIMRTDMASLVASPMRKIISLQDAAHRGNRRKPSDAATSGPVSSGPKTSHRKKMMENDVFEVRMLSSGQLERSQLAAVTEDRNFAHEYASRVLDKIGVAPTKQNMMLLEKTFVPEDFRVSTSVDRQTANRVGSRHIVSVTAAGRTREKSAQRQEEQQKKMRAAVAVSLQELRAPSEMIRAQQSPAGILQQQHHQSAKGQHASAASTLRAANPDFFSPALIQHTSPESKLLAIDPSKRMLPNSDTAITPDRIAKELQGGSSLALMDVLLVIGQDQPLQHAQFVGALADFCMRSFMDQRSPLANSLIPPAAADADYDFEIAEAYHALDDMRFAAAKRNADAGLPAYAYLRLDLASLNNRDNQVGNTSVGSSPASSSASSPPPPSDSDASRVSAVSNNADVDGSNAGANAAVAPLKSQSSVSRLPSRLSRQLLHQREEEAKAEEKAVEQSLQFPQRFVEICKMCLDFVAQVTPSLTATMPRSSSSMSPERSSSSLSTGSRSTIAITTKIRSAVRHILVSSFPMWAASASAASTLIDIDNFLRLMLHHDLVKPSAASTDGRSTSPTKRVVSPLVRFLMTGGGSVSPPKSLGARKLLVAAHADDDEYLLTRVLSVMDQEARWALLGTVGSHQSHHCGHQPGRAAYSLFSRTAEQHDKDIELRERRRNQRQPKRATTSLSMSRSSRASKLGFLSNTDYEQDYNEVSRMVDSWTSHLPAKDHRNLGSSGLQWLQPELGDGIVEDESMGIEDDFD